MMFSLRSRYSRGVVLATTLGLTVLESGCYEYSQVPSAATEAVPGSNLAFSLSDQGRAALAERLGPSVGRVEGRYVGLVGDDYAVDVSAIETLGAGRAHWSGERVGIPRQYVIGISERKLSRGKTALMVAGAVTAIAVFVGTRSLIGNGTPEPGTPAGNGGAGATRIPHF
jgi:hypothetical protein